MNKYKRILLSFSLIVLGVFSYAQNENVELNILVEKTLKNNKRLEAILLKTESSKANMGTAYDFDKTNFYYNYDESNIAPNDKVLRVFGLEQSFSFPTVYAARRKVYKSQWGQSKALYEIEKNKLVFEVSQLYEQVVYLQNKESLYQYLDSLYVNFSRAGRRKFELGDTNYLEKITAEAKSKQIYTILAQLKSRKKASYEQLQALVQDNQDSLIIKNDKLELLELNSEGIGQILQKEYMETVSQTYNSQLKLQNQSWLPDLNIELFTGTNKNLGYNQNGFKVGIALPLFFSGNIAKKKTIKLEMQSWEMEKMNHEIKMNHFFKQQEQLLNEHKEMINYYTENGKHLSQEIIKTADMSYKNGEIDFFQYIQSMESAISIEVDYLESVLSYNKSYLELYYFNYNL